MEDLVASYGLTLPAAQLFRRRIMYPLTTLVDEEEEAVMGVAGASVSGLDGWMDGWVEVCMYVRLTD